jgi:long-chain acyl-CoA synthetase
LLPPYKTPILIDVRTEEFPRNASGKTLKPQLRAEVLAKLAPA